MSSGSVEDWWKGLQNDIDDRSEDEKRADAEADEWLGENETIDTLNAKEAKLQEALKAVREAKAKLSK